MLNSRNSVNFADSVFCGRMPILCKILQNLRAPYIGSRCVSCCSAVEWSHVAAVLVVPLLSVEVICSSTLCKLQLRKM